MSQTRRAYLSLVAVSLIFGLNYTVTKEMLAAIQPLQLIFFRLLGGVVMFWLFQRLFVRERVERRDLLMLAVCGLFGFALNQTLFYVGMKHTTPVDASVIHVLNPVMVLIFAHFIIREKITVTKTLGILLGASGALILILYGRTLNLGGDTMLGNVMVFLNMVFYALYLVLIKPMVGKYHTTTILKWVSFFGFLFVLPFSVGPAWQTDFSAFTPMAWAGLAYIIIPNTFLAYLLINYALKQVTPGVVSYFNYLQPLIAAISSLTIGADILVAPKIVAAVLIFAGVWVVNRKGRSE